MADPVNALHFAILV